MKLIKEQYENIVKKYIKLFELKHEICFEDWIGDNIGEIASFGDIMYFNFDDIRRDIDLKQPKGQMIEWLYFAVDNESNLNYRSYIMGLRK